MRKKYFTDEEKKEAHRLEGKRYYDTKRKPKLSEQEKEVRKLEQKLKRKIKLSEYYLSHKEKYKQYSHEYFKQNKTEKLRKNNERSKKRRKEDPIYRLILNLKRHIRYGMKKHKLTKKSKTIQILGCTYEEFKIYIESKFEFWMNWDNYGLYNGGFNYGWDLDHIIPISIAMSEEELIKLNHYTNLQPLCSKINRDIKRHNIS